MKLTSQLEPTMLGFVCLSYTCIMPVVSQLFLRVKIAFVTSLKRGLTRKWVLGI